MSGRSKNHTLKGGTSLYSLCMGVSPWGNPVKSWVQLHNTLSPDTVAHDLLLFNI